ncbi:unnamed protein product [Withania somnifera]
MSRILGKDVKFSTMVIRSEAEIEDLSSWEFVNPSDDEQEDSYSFTDDELMLKEYDPCEIGSPSSVISMELESPSQVQTIGALVVCNVGYDYHDDDDDDQEEEEEEDEEEDFDFDDDELVPNWISDKFGRQRIRKLGKRVSSRMNKSKKGPYIFNKPGCVRGKHGFGVQHSNV